MMRSTLPVRDYTLPMMQSARDYTLPMQSRPMYTLPERDEYSTSLWQTHPTKMPQMSMVSAVGGATELNGLAAIAAVLASVTAATCLFQ